MLCLLTLCCLLLAAGEVRREAWPDGKPKSEFEVEVRADGREVRSGAYHSWHADGTAESEGSFADDRETGRWKYFHPGGAPAAEGSFAKGERTGLWETFHASGKRASKGRYEKGAKTGEWGFWNEDGSPDALESGVYATSTLALADGTPRIVVRLDGALHGPITHAWPDGKPMLSGRLARGKRVGVWEFHNPDGSLAPLLSGTYADDRRTGPATLELAPNAPYTAPTLEPGVLGWPANLSALDNELEGWVTSDDAAIESLRQEIQRREMQPNWMTAGARAVPAVLRRLFDCDPSKGPGRQAIGRIERRLLRPLCGGHALVTLPATGPATPDAAREFQRAWATLWAATRDDAWFWRVEVPCTRVGSDDELLRDRPFRLALRALEPAPERPALYARRFEARDAKAAGPLQAAVEWLETHRMPDGHWSASVDTEKHWDMNDVGVTALALLALLGAGRTPADSPVVSDALGWLLQHQGADGKLPAEPDTQMWLYGHSMATIALCETQALFPSEALRARSQLAVDLLFSARNPAAVWRYAYPPDGDNDTSVSSWATTALFVAREAGLTGDFDTAFAVVRAWLDEMTDPETGRVGYNTQGTYSARSTVNQRFPAEAGEAMTAAALFARRLLGVGPQDKLVQKGMLLLKSKPPLWDPKSLGIDEYYFYYGAEALAVYGTLGKSPWNAALEAIGRAQSGNAKERGSWDPVGVWGYCGGRVYSTAMLALMLEAPFRYTLPELPAADPKKDKGKEKPKKK